MATLFDKEDRAIGRTKARQRKSYNIPIRRTDGSANIPFVGQGVLNNLFYEATKPPNRDGCGGAKGVAVQSV